MYILLCEGLGEPCPDTLMECVDLEASTVER